MSTITVYLLLSLSVLSTINGQGQSCLDGFASVTNNTCTSSSCPFQGLTGNSRQLQLFPSMRITCNGMLVGLSVAGETRKAGNSNYPILQIWRPTGPMSNDYEKISEYMYTFPNVGCTQTNNVWQCTVSPSIDVEVGDIIGINLPRNHMNFAAFGIYFTPSSFTSYILGSTTASTFSVPGSTTASAQPVLTLNIQEQVTEATTLEPTTQASTTEQASPSTPSSDPPAATGDGSTGSPPEDTSVSSVATSTSTSTNGDVSTTPPQDDTYVSSVAATSAHTGTPSMIQVDATTTTASASGASSKNQTGTEAVVIVLILLLLLALGTVTVVLILYWRKHRRNARIKTLQFQGTGSTRSNAIGMRILTTDSKIEPLLERKSLDELETDKLHYDYVVDSQYSMITTSQMYEAPGPDLSSEPEYQYATVEATTPSRLNQNRTGPVADRAVDWGVVVPSLEQRQLYNTMRYECSPLSESESIYDVIKSNTLQQEQLSFFEEADVYWAPSSDAKELYKQLSLKRYREILRQSVQIVDVLGSGAFGTVSQGVWQSPGGAMEVAIKTNQSKEEGDRIKFLQEAAIMGQFRHPNIVKLIGVVTLGEPVMIVLELLSNGDLHKFLNKMRPRPNGMVPSSTPKLLLGFCKQVSCGMKYLAEKGFVHRDLAARNVLLSQDKCCKISDFGMSRDLMDESYYVSQGGKIPVKWTAPEALYYSKYSTASDVWSFGCVMYEIWSLGHKPFEAFSNNETLRKVEKGLRLPPPPGCSRELYKVMIACWNPDSSERPSFPQLVEKLSHADFELLLWKSEDIGVGPKVSLVGSPLKAGQHLYRDLQLTYLTSPNVVLDWFA